MHRIALSIVMYLALMGYAGADEDISSIWLDLFTRCRIAVETASDFDGTGLTDLGRRTKTFPPLTAPGLPQPIMPGYQIPEQHWGVPGDRFAVVDAESPPSRGKARRTCDIVLAPGAAPISVLEENLLRAAFLAELYRLLATGRYDEHWSPDPIFSTSMGIRLADKNANGCRVVSVLMIGMLSWAPFLYTGSGEQSGICGGTPRFVHP